MPAPTRYAEISRWLTIAIAFLIPVVFWRGAIDSFDLVKGVTLWTLVAVLSPLVLGHRWLVENLPRPFLMAGVFFALAVVLSTLTSMDRVISLWGQSQRYTGALTLISCSVLSVSVAAFFRGPVHLRLIRALVAAGFLVGAYSWLQEIEADPFEWSVVSFGKFVFGTMGNPNTASGLISMIIPLGAYLMLLSKTPLQRALGGVAYGLFVGSLASLDSFQGSVAAITSLLFLFGWFWDVARTHGGAVIAGIAGAAVVVFPNATFGNLGVNTVGLAAFFGALGWYAATLSRIRLRGSGRLWAAGLGSVGVAIAALFGNRGVSVLRDGVAGGMVERGDFYRAATGVFRDNPIFGSGLESFGFVFSEYRPASHALNLESSRTSSVHSVHLGMFSNGGVLLGVAYLLLACVTGWILWRGLRASGAGERMPILAVGCAWLASHVQGAVSVEHVALFSTQFILTGLVVAVSINTGSEAKRMMRSRSSSSLWIAIGVVAALVVSVSILSRPLRANVAAKGGLAAAYERGDGDQALRSLGRAVDLAPWEPFYRLQRIQIYQALDQTSLAVDDAERAIELLHGSPAATIELARVIATSGRFDVASPYVEEAVKNDPFAIGVKQSAADYYVDVGFVLKENESPEGARDYFGRALVHVPDDPRALEGLASLDS